MTTIEARSRNRLLLGTGAGVLAVALVATVVGLLVGPEHRVDSGDVVYLSVVTAGLVAIWALVSWLAREPDHANRAALAGVVFGVLGVLALPAFWTNVPLVFGAAAVVLGRFGASRAEHGAGRARLARAAGVVGWSSLALWLLAYVFLQDGLLG